MSRFAHVNLFDVEESISARVEGLRRPLRPQELSRATSGISHFRYAPGFRSPAGHRHREQEEAYVVVAGSGQVLIDDELRDFVLWDVVRVAPEAIRAFAAGPDGLELIAIGGPKPEGGDGEQTEIHWPEGSPPRRVRGRGGIGVYVTGGI